MQIEHIYSLWLKCNYKFSTDTRNIEKNSIFFALKGSNFDANTFAFKALELGAQYVIADDINLKDERIIIVNDVLNTLQNLANYHRKQFNIPLIGIGGSNGKTTTKELIRYVLQQQYDVLCTEGNFNNHIGVPLTLLSLRPNHQIAIIELGTNKIGDIEELCNIAEPTCGLITNIGKEHLEGFGSLEGVAKAESELYEYLHSVNGTAFVNEKDECLMNLSQNIKDRILFNNNPNSKYGISYQSIIPQIIIEKNNVKIQSVLFGLHNFENIKSAFTIGTYFDISLENIAKGIKEYVPTNKRSEIINYNSNLIILDAYNANPSSMEPALHSLSQIDKQFKVAILGDMFELGDFSESEHDAIAQLCIDLNIDDIFLVGHYFSISAQKLQLKSFENVGVLNSYLVQKTWENTAFLIKGSRGMAMEACLDTIKSKSV